MAGVDPRTISYVEAHGTGTGLGDPIEIAALSAVYGRDADEPGWCGIGSVKSNIGHLSQAAGVVAVIKAVLALEHGLIPPTINYEKPNPGIDFDATPFFPARDPVAWKRADRPRRAGVSSFGIGGTNAHVVLEEAPDRVPGPARDPAGAPAAGVGGDPDRAGRGAGPAGRRHGGGRRRPGRRRPHAAGRAAGAPAPGRRGRPGHGAGRGGPAGPAATSSAGTPRRRLRRWRFSSPGRAAQYAGHGRPSSTRRAGLRGRGGRVRRAARRGTSGSCSSAPARTRPRRCAEPRAPSPRCSWSSTRWPGSGSTGACGRRR